MPHGVRRATHAARIQRLDCLVGVLAERGDSLAGLGLQPLQLPLPAPAELGQFLVAAPRGHRSEEDEQRGQVLELLHREAQRLVPLEEAIAHRAALLGERDTHALGGRPAMKPAGGGERLELGDQLLRGVGAALQNPRRGVRAEAPEQGPPVLGQLASKGVKLPVTAIFRRMQHR
jgi:hypothetical protein